MSVFDTKEVMFETQDISATGYVGTALSVAAAGDGVGLRLGVPYEAELKVRGAITGTAPTLAVVIRATDSAGNVEDIATFGQIGGTTQPTASFGDGEGSIKRVVCLTSKQSAAATPLEWVNVRAHATAGGTTPVFNDVDLILRPLINGVSVS